MPPNEDKNEYEETELCLDEFKEKLGKRASSMSHMQIKNLYEMECRLADLFLNRWLKEENDTQELYN